MFLKLGKVAATSFVQGGSGLHIFSPSVFNYIRGMNVSDIFAGLDEVPKPDVRDIAQKVVITFINPRHAVRVTVLAMLFCVCVCLSGRS